MGTLLQTVHLPLFTIVSAGALDELPKALADAHLSFRRGLVLSGSGATAPIGARVAASLSQAGMDVQLQPLAGGTFAEVDRVKRELVEGTYPDVLFAVGGGSILDVVKLAAAERRLPWISLPTAASNDGFCSPVAVLRGDGPRRNVGGEMPIGVIADLDVMRSADPRLRRAGFGDLLSNLTACEDWKRAAAIGKASMNGMAATFALSGARQVLTAALGDTGEDSLSALLVEGLMLSGVAMAVCGTSRPCSGAEHLVSHELDRMGAGHGLHGEQVGVATLFCMALQGGDPAVLRAFGAATGMLVHPEALGVDRNTFLHAARHGPETRPGRWTILTEVSDEQLARAWELAFEP
jgi:glycerol-1-phosphate dehydrogenase [NAD(P)+]